MRSNAASLDNEELFLITLLSNKIWSRYQLNETRRNEKIATYMNFNGYINFNIIHIKKNIQIGDRNHDHSSTRRRHRQRLKAQVKNSVA